MRRGRGGGAGVLVDFFAHRMFRKSENSFVQQTAGKKRNYWTANCVRAEHREEVNPHWFISPMETAEHLPVTDYRLGSITSLQFAVDFH